jgi:YVTN family beta-propeller protein
MLHRPHRSRIALIAPLAGLLLASCNDITEPNNPLPALFSTEPAIIDAGSTTGATVTLIGDGFVKGSRARWNGGDRPTSFVNPTHLSVQLTAADVANVGAGQFVVLNPPPGGGTSSSLTVPIRPPLLSGVTVLLLGGRPHGVATAANGLFYVSLIDAGAVAKGIVSAATQSISGTVSIGSSTPAHVALDVSGTRAYTANQFGRSVSIVDATNNSLLATIALPDQGFNLLVSPSGARLYVSTEAGHLHVIDTGTRQIVATVDVGPAANGIALDATANRLYVSSISGGTVTAIDLATNTVLRTYGVSSGAQRIALSPNATELYIASESVGLEILNLSTGSRAAVSGVFAGAVGLALSPDGGRLFVTNPPAGIVQIVDRASRTVTRTLNNMGRPRNVAFGANGAVAIITDENGRVLFVRS